MFPRVSVAGLPLVLLACHGGPGARPATASALQASQADGAVETTVRPARFVPAAIDEGATWGVEPGGGVRVMTAGVRGVRLPRGAVATAADRLPGIPQATLPLPERLGGGFLFSIGGVLWRADRWLGPARPIYAAGGSIQAVTPGLDRVYVRAQSGTMALDPRDGTALDLGPWPASPNVTSYAAVDGWRAAAIADLRGVVATFDAGATWRHVELPIDPKQVVASGDSLAVAGLENGKSEAWFELRPDGGVGRLGAPPRDAKLAAPLAARGAKSTESDGASRPPPAGPADEPTAKLFAGQPLAAAVEDGWPLTDGTALVARDGALARVRLADGALVEIARDAFPLSPAICHPVSLARKAAPGAFGFVCADPRGATAIYAYDAARGRLVERRRFDRPRAVTASGAGALAVRGGCAADAEAVVAPRPEPALPVDDLATGEGARTAAKPAPKRAPAITTHAYCVLGQDDAWREIHVRGDASSERVVPLADGRLAVLSPPETIDGPARLTLQGGGTTKTTIVTFAGATSDVARLLRLGFWLDGFEERRPGVLGGWVEAGGAVLGIEIELDGKARTGAFVQDVGLAFVAGRYGLGWSPSWRGYETTDGGMTWTSIDLPGALVPPAKVERRSCGPVGCLANGWLRVGWGEPKAEPRPTPPPRRATSSLVQPSLALACEPGAPPTPTPPVIAAAKHTEGAGPAVRGGGPPVLGTFNGLTELPAFLQLGGPAVHDPDRGVTLEVRELLERTPNVGPLARVYGWGPKTGEWETLGHWQIRWLSPFAGWPEARSTLPAPPPPAIVEMTRSGSGYAWSGGWSWQLGAADDASHALLTGRRRGNEAVLWELEAERAPIEIRRADGEPFGELEGVVRVAGRWILASSGTGAGGATSIVWQVEGGMARELARIPRVVGENESRSSYGLLRTRLTRRSDGRAVGFVVDGQAGPERAVAVRWVLPIDLESGALGEPESLGYTDLAGRTLEACGEQASGWVLDVPLGTRPKLRLPGGTGGVTNVLARLHLSSDRACVERLAGTAEGTSTDPTTLLTRPGPASRGAGERPGLLPLAIAAGTSRYPLRCSLSK